METLTATTATCPVRMRVDLAEKLEAITWAAGFRNTADGIDAIIRPLIEEKFAVLPEAIRQRALARIAAQS